MGRDEKPHRAQPRLPAMPHPRVMSAGTDIAAAYRRCEAITRTRAGNFYYGIRLLPAPKRRALCAVYAFARRVDDIGDGSLPVEVKLERLDGVRRSLARIDPASPDPILSALGHRTTRFHLPISSVQHL